IKKIAILAILTAIAYLVTALAQIVAVHIYPIILFVILGAVLLSPKNALVYSVFLSLLLMSVTTNGQDLIRSDSLIILLTTLTGSFFAIYTLKNMQYRSRLVLAGLVAVIPGVCIEIIIYLLKMINMQQMFYGMAIMTGSGVLCGIVSIGVLPLIENAFKLTTPTKLLELSDPNHPLIKRLVVEAPGTYHHSILVANLAEAACNAVGGFSLLARVGAYFHDVGKIENPLYFKENQRNNVNPHDDLTP
ncbi:MAG: HDIG domain-containing protein, partial [Christensenellaceae bacterium]